MFNIPYFSLINYNAKIIKLSNVTKQKLLKKIKCGTQQMYSTYITYQPIYRHGSSINPCTSSLTV